MSTPTRSRRSAYTSGGSAKPSRAFGSTVVLTKSSYASSCVDRVERASSAPVTAYLAKSFAVPSRSVAVVESDFSTSRRAHGTRSARARCAIVSAFASSTSDDDPGDSPTYFLSRSTAWARRASDVWSSSSTWTPANTMRATSQHGMMRCSRVSMSRTSRSALRSHDRDVLQDERVALPGAARLEFLTPVLQRGDVASAEGGPDVYRALVGLLDADARGGFRLELRLDREKDAGVLVAPDDPRRAPRPDGRRDADDGGGRARARRAEGEDGCGESERGRGTKHHDPRSIIRAGRSRPDAHELGVVRCEA